MHAGHPRMLGSEEALHVGQFVGTRTSVAIMETCRRGATLGSIVTGFYRGQRLVSFFRLINR